MHLHSIPISPRSQQSGMVLITSLIFLVVLTLIGVTAMRTTTLQERMAGNLHDADLAFQAAEAGLRDGENKLYNSNFTKPRDFCHPKPQCTNTIDFSDQPWNWWQKKGAKGNTVSATAAAQRYIVQYSGSSKNCPADSVGGGGRDVGGGSSGSSAGSYFFRITSASIGGSDVSTSGEKPRRVLQSVVVIPSPQC